MSDSHGNALPFSPIPHEASEMRFNPPDEWTYTATPLQVMWEDAYRSAGIAILGRANDGEALRLARLAMDMERAYLTRTAEEYQIRQAALVATS